MNRIMNKVIFISATLFILVNFIFDNDTLAWDDKVTHRDLSEFAAENSVISKGKGDYLKNLGFEKGLDEIFKWGGTEQKLRKWLQDGAELEDAQDPLFPVYGTTRSFNHFHNPLTPWNQAGLNDNWTGKSSLLWAQDGTYQQNFPEGDWSWQKTRLCYYYALTPQTENNRQAFFACTFRGLGHQMHLIQDAAQPDHVRNDAHPEDAIFGKNRLNGARYFETWAKEKDILINSLASSPFFPEVSLNISNNNLAPITQFIDTKQYYNGGTPSTNLTQGIAEYTNANFFSGDTIFAAERYSTDHRHYFPYPKKSSTDLQAYMAQIKPLLFQIAEDGIQDKGTWIKKIGDGETIDRFVRTSRWTSKIYKTFGEGSLFYSSFYRDEKCNEDYAQKLIPRAVGYSAGLLDYFFRGSMDITLPPTGIYSLAETRDGGFVRITLLARNTTSTGEEMTDGSIELVARYRTVQEDPFQPFDLQASNAYTYRVAAEANNRRTIPRDLPVELVFDNGQTAIIPVNAVDVSLQVVYKGRLGNEYGAVAAALQPVSDPTPVELANNMDRICLNSKWYVAGSPEAIAQVDTNNNGIPEWDIYPHNLKDAYVKTSPPGSPVNATPAVYTFHSELIPAGSLHRAFILGGPGSQVICSHYVTAVKTDPADTFTHVSDTFRGTWAGNTIKSEIEYSDNESVCNSYGFARPCTIRHAVPFYSFRGTYMWGPTGVIFDNPEYPPGQKCSWQLLQ